MCVGPPKGGGLLRLTKDIPTPRVVVVVVLTSPRLAVSRDRMGSQVTFG